MVKGREDAKFIIIAGQYEHNQLLWYFFTKYLIINIAAVL